MHTSYLPAHLLSGQPVIPEGTYLTDPTGDYLCRPREERTQRSIAIGENYAATVFHTECNNGRRSLRTVLGRRAGRRVVR